MVTTRRGSTRIKLLPVIAIVAVMAAILIPVSALAREKTCQISCLSGQRRMRNVLMTYMQDNGEQTPLANQRTTNGSACPCWPDMIPQHPQRPLRLRGRIREVDADGGGRQTEREGCHAHVHGRGRRKLVGIRSLLVLALLAPSVLALPEGERECRSPDCLVVENVHSERGQVRSIGILDTRLHLYVWVPPGVDRFTLGVHDQQDEVAGQRPSAFELYAPDGQRERMLDRPLPGAWSDYPVPTAGRWGVWRLSVTGPEDVQGPEGRPVAGAPHARNAFMVRTLGQVDLYLRPEPVARTQGLRLGAPRFGGGPHALTVQVTPGGSSPQRFRWHALLPAGMPLDALQLVPPPGTMHRETRRPLERDDRLRPGVAFAAVDEEGPALGGPWRFSAAGIPSGTEYGLGTDGEFRLFCTDRPLMPAPVAVPVRTGSRAARLALTSEQTRNETWVTNSGERGEGTVGLLAGVAYKIRATRGPEFAAAEITADTTSREVRLDPERVVDRPAGWYAGDTHLHSAYYDGTQTPRQMVEAARAAGLDWVIPTEHAHGPVPERAERVAEETRPLIEPGRFLVIPGMEFTTSTFHANLYGTILSIPATAGLPEILSAARAADTVERPVAASLNHPTLGKTAAELARTTEGVGLLELWNSAEPAATRLWWELLNRGQRVFAVTGSDSHHRVNAEPGFRRTCVYLGKEPLAAPAVVRTLREGRSFLTRGPWLELTLAGARPGQSVAPGSVTATIDVRSGAPLDHLELVSAGRVARRVELEGRTRYSDSWTLSAEPGWYLVQLFARGESLPSAMTNPIFVRPEKPGKVPPPPPGERS